MNGSRTFSSDAIVLVAAVGAAGLVGALAVGNGFAVLMLPTVLVGAVILFARPVIGLFLVAATIPLEAALMVGGRSVVALIGIAVFGVWAAQKLLRREPLIPLVSSGLIQLALLLFALGCMSILWAQSPAGVPWRAILLLQLILLSVLVLDLTSSWERAAWVAKALVLAGAVAALLTVEQYFVGGARRAGGDVTGSLNRTASTMVTILPFAFFLWRSRESTFWRILGMSYVGMSAVAVSATLSRMNFLLFPMVVFFHLALMARTRGERGRVLMLAAIAAFVVSFLPMEAVRQRADTILPFLASAAGVEQVSEEEYRPTDTARTYFMRLGWEMFKDRPVLGSGFGSFQAQAHLYQWDVSRSPFEWLRPGRSPHSSHVAFLADVGLVGFLMWIGLLVVGLRYGWRAWQGGSDPRSHQVLLAQAVGVAVVLQLLYGFYSEVHQDKIVWLILGLAVAVHRLAKASAGGAWQEPSRRRTLRRAREGAR